MSFAEVGMHVRMIWKISGSTLFAGALLVGACTSSRPGELGNSQGDDASYAGCTTPHPGCGCSSTGSTACGEVVTRDGNYVTCSEGTMTCQGGTWGPCIGTHNVFKSLGPLGGSGGGGIHLLDFADAGSCMGNPCDPTCQGFTGDNSNNVDGGGSLTPTDAGGWTLVPETGACVGLQCQVPTCGMGQTTTLTGKVYDPAALNPVFNALVMIPSAAVQPVPPGVSSDPCGGATLPPAITFANSAIDGTFTLTGVPVAPSVPIVIQIGRWRRIVNVNTSTLMCGQSINLSAANCNGNGNYAGSAACQTRLPRVQAEGNIPHIAIGTGGLDAMECMLYRMGVDVSEFTDEYHPGRVHVFHNGGSVLPGPNANDDISYLLGFTCPAFFCPGANPPSLTNNYDLIMLPCNGGAEYGSARWAAPNDDPGRQNLVNYANVGGRVFTSHWGREWIERTSAMLPTGPFPGVATWMGDVSGGTDLGVINTAQMYGNNLDLWLIAIGATAGNTITINPVREDTSAVSAASRLFVSYQATGDPADFTFDTPLGGMASGRVMYTDMHLASGTPSGTFPGNCPTQGTALIQQEDAAEYLLFDLGSCVNGAMPLPPPQYAPSTFTRDFQGTCPMGSKVVWRFFYWEDATPSDSNIVFGAYTADTQAQLGTQFPLVNLATASGPDNCPNGPSCASSFVGVDVDPALVAAGQMSDSWLRVNMTLNPSSDKLTPPTLIAWQQMYDCVPAE
jgi:hypothetical protein